MAIGRRFPSLGEWLAWQQALHPQAIDLGLERARRVLVRTGWRRPRLPVVTVGGTNGKGSCVALLAAMLQGSGRRVATFTSPHLVEYRERIRIGGDPVSEASLVAAFERIADALGPDSLTFFEFNALAALLVFETTAPDAIVLEVGMGGRLDAVNLVDADAAVIVSVGLDHVEWLGPDLESIGREKAGIMRRGRPAIVGTPTPPQSVLDAAQRDRRRSPPARTRLRRSASSRTAHGTYRDDAGELAGLPAPALAGAEQIGNAAVALAAIRSLQERLALGRTAVEEGLRRVRLPGRFQRIADRRGFEWVLDVAHNPDAARTLAASLRDTRPRDAPSRSAACWATRMSRESWLPSARVARALDRRAHGRSAGSRRSRPRQPAWRPWASRWSTAGPWPMQCTWPPPVPLQATESSSSGRSTPSGRHSAAAGCTAARRDRAGLAIIFRWTRPSRRD